MKYLIKLSFLLCIFVSTVSAQNAMPYIHSCGVEENSAYIISIDSIKYDTSISCRKVDSSLTCDTSGCSWDWVYKCDTTITSTALIATYQFTIDFTLFDEENDSCLIKPILHKLGFTSGPIPGKIYFAYKYHKIDTCWGDFKTRGGINKKITIVFHTNYSTSYTLLVELILSQFKNPSDTTIDTCRLGLINFSTAMVSTKHTPYVIKNQNKNLRLSIDNYLSVPPEYLNMPLTLYNSSGKIVNTFAPQNHTHIKIPHQLNNGVYYIAPKNLGGGQVYKFIKF